MTSYKTRQIEALTSDLTFSQEDVSQTVRDYIRYLRYLLESEQHATFLGLVDIRPKGTPFRWGKTLAYQASEIARERGRSSAQVLRILEAYKEQILGTLLRGERVVVNGLLALDTSDDKVRLVSSGFLPKGLRSFDSGQLKYEFSRLTAASAGVL